MSINEMYDYKDDDALIQDVDDFFVMYTGRSLGSVFADTKRWNFVRNFILDREAYSEGFFDPSVAALHLSDMASGEGLMEMDDVPEFDVTDPFELQEMVPA